MELTSLKNFVQVQNPQQPQKPQGEVAVAAWYGDLPPGHFGHPTSKHYHLGYPVVGWCHKEYWKSWVALEMATE